MSGNKIFANDLPYDDASLNPLDALSQTLCFASNDWGASRAEAWIYGIVVGWDNEDDPADTAAMDELAGKYRWSPEQVERLRTLHTRFVALAASGVAE